MSLSPEKELALIEAELQKRGREVNATTILNPALDILSGGDPQNWYSVPDYSHYADRPYDFCKDILGVHLWSKQVEILNSIHKHPKTTVRSCHGVGKTFMASCATLWFLYTHPNSVVITTAPAARTVSEQIWKEIGDKHGAKRLAGRCLTTKLELAKKWFALGLSTDDPTKFQGYHSKDILLIVDEAAGVEQAIYEAADGILTTEGSRQLLIGNPTSTSGKFFDSHHSLQSMWSTLHISVFDCPNFTDEPCPQAVKDYLVTRCWQEERLLEYGGEDTPLYQVRVLGNFVDQTETGLISLLWIEACEKNTTGVDDGPIEAGIDVARQGGCETVIYIRRGSRILHMDAWTKQDTTYSSGRLTQILREHRVRVAKIDIVGVGAGVYDNLQEAKRNREHNAEIVGVHGGDPPRDLKKFLMLRDELWWNTRTLMQEGAFGPLTDEKTKGQLSAIQYSYDRRGHIIVESKKDMQARRKPSPDRADALTLAFALTSKIRRRVWAF